MTMLLQQAARNWANMQDFRSRRIRAKRYCYGLQWDDTICVDGQYIREEDYIRSQGNVPLKNNLIRRLVRSVLGVFRNQYEIPTAQKLNLDPSDSRDMALYERLVKNSDYNQLSELFARTMEEFLISGLAVIRKSTSPFASRIPGVVDLLSLRSDGVAAESFFVDAATRDYRGWDCRMIGQTHDLDFNARCAAMARSEADVETLRKIYFTTAGLPTNDYSAFAGNFGSSDLSSPGDFYSPSGPGLCRVIEVWTREALPRYRVHDRLSGEIFKIEADRLKDFIKNRDDKGVIIPPGNHADGQFSFTWMMEEVWNYHFFAPSGEILREGRSPLPGGCHPYVWKAYPFIDGEIHSFVTDVIDQQRHTNRLITLYDWVLRSTAKGVLLFPESALLDGVEIDDISDQWSRFNGVILFKPKAGMPLPQQVTGNASKVGITDLLNIQLQMFEDVSGVSSALEGKLASGAVSGTLYTQQTRQALTALLDILESYNHFIRQSFLLDLQMMK